MGLFNNLNKDNLHHAYLIEGIHQEVLSEVLAFIESIGVSTVASSDFTHIHLDSFRVDDARDLKSLAKERGYTDNKKIFLISANNFLLEAQNTLLKLFEEPIENTIFFLVVPDRNILLPTLHSRFYFLSDEEKNKTPSKQISQFLKMSLSDRILFIKDLINEEELKDDEGKKMLIEDGARIQSLKFLNQLEATLSESTATVPVNVFEHIFKVREFLRIPGASVKNMMESVALITPKL